MVWPCTNNFLGPQVRKSKGEDGTDAETKLLEKATYFFLLEC